MKNKSTGFSLVEVMIAIALMGAAAVYFMKFQQNQMRSQKTVVNSAALSEYMTSVKGYLTKPGVCQKSFGELSLKEDEELEGIVRPDGELKYAVGDKLGSSSFKLESMSFKDIFIGEVPDGETTARAEAQLELVFKKSGKGSYGNKTIKKIFELDIQVNDSNVILDCAPLGHLSLPSSSSSSDSESGELGSDELDKAFDSSIQSAMKATGKKVDQQDINTAIKNNPQLQEAMKSMNNLKELNKKMEEALNQP